MPNRASLVLEALDSGAVRAALKLRMEQAASLKDEQGGGTYRDDPVGFIEQRLKEFIWSKQREVARAVAEYPRVAVPSAFELGKSRIASRLCAWWLNTRPFGEAFVVTTAPTASQVRAILWREIGRAYWSGKLAGRLNQTEWWMEPTGSRYMAPAPGEELVAIGRKSSDYDQHSFQGLHQRYLLVIIDEGAGVAKAIFDAAESLAANEDSRILVIGNPTDPQSHFATISTRPGTRWHVIRMDAYDSPNWTNEEVPPELHGVLMGTTYAQRLAEDTLMVPPGEPVIVAQPEARIEAEATGLIAPDEPPELPQEFGYDPRTGQLKPATIESATYKNKVRGEFTADDPSSIVPLSFVRKCQVEREWPDGGVVELGCDVGAGGDEFVVRERQGPKVGRKWSTNTRDWREAVATAVRAIDESHATCVKVDVIGIGWGVAGRLEELYVEGRSTARVVKVNVGQGSTDPTRFPKLRDQLWFEVGRDLTVTGGWDLTGLDESTIQQLTAVRKVPDSAGRDKVEPKETTISRLGRSPDDADALLLAYYVENGTAFSPVVGGEGRAPVVAPVPGQPVAAGSVPGTYGQYIESAPIKAFGRTDRGY